MLPVTDSGSAIGAARSPDPDDGILSGSHVRALTVLVVRIQNPRSLSQPERNAYGASMGTRRARRIRDHRVPLTIMLEPEMLAFIERCAQSRRFRSVDAFFDSALNVFRRHVDALDAYIELEQASGQSFEEIVDSTQCELVVTRRAKAAQLKR